jgi:Spy/CpxP family protein refolding chaperone
MRKLAGLAITSALLLVLVPVAVPMAQEEEQEGMPMPSEMSAQMGMCPMHRMMMQGMHGGRMCMGKGRGEGWTHDPMGRMLHHSGGPGFYEMHAEHLELSDGQMTQIKGIWSDHKKAAIRKKADIEIAEMELQEILDRQPVDFDKAKSKIERIGSLRQDVQVGVLEAMRKSHDVLTEEQSGKLMMLRKHGRCGKMQHGGKMKHGKMMQGMEMKD